MNNYTLFPAGATVKTQVIVGMKVSNQEMDMGLMSKMQMQLISAFNIKRNRSRG